MPQTLCERVAAPLLDLHRQTSSPTAGVAILTGAIWAGWISCWLLSLISRSAQAGSEIMVGANAAANGVKDAGWGSPEALKRDLHEMVDGLAKQIMEAVNGARKGQLINDSEEPVRVAGHEFLRAAFEAAFQ